MTNKLKVKVVYFAYLHQDIWEPIVMEQLNSLKQTQWLLNKKAKI